MIPLPLQLNLKSRTAVLVALLSLAAGLGGCAGVGDSFASGAFVDPARYDLYDCPQLEAERKSLVVRTADLQRLIDKAQTGAAGLLVGEAVYRNDYISARAQAKLAEEAWQRNKCVEAAPATPAVAAPAAAAAPHSKRRS